MTDGAESPVLERVRHTRGRVDQIAEDVRAEAPHDEPGNSHEPGQARSGVRG